MRGSWPGFVLTVAVLLPNIGNAQVFQSGTPPPVVSAAGAEWQIDSAPVLVGGLMYYPTRAFHPFDGQVMAQSGTYENVPVYSDKTIEPYSELYVPFGNGMVRVYERRRDGDLAGTTGSHVPTFPVASPSVPEPVERAVGTAGSSVPKVATESAVLPDTPQPRRTSIITPVSHSKVGDRVWLEFNGARWYSNGPTSSFSAERFEPVGRYHGFPVYRDKTSGSDEIWVSVVKDGPLAPYAKRQR
jgi:hypothetical protein